VTPDRLFRRLAVTEAITWALLLAGMFLKYVTETTELGVRIFGMAHGIAFVAYCVTTVVVAVDQRWSFRRALAALACAVPPFATVPFDRYAERRRWLASSWRLAGESPTGRLDAPVAWLLHDPLRGVVAGLVAVAALTGLALVVGPPAG
jgi:integral membrane protein